MKKVIAIIALFVLPCIAVSQERKLGAGIIIGEPTGISGKYWFDKRHAIDGALTFTSNALHLHFDYLWHDYHAFPAPEEGELPLYYGAGVRALSSGGLGLRGVIGIEYLFQDYPFDIFLELAPVLTIAPSAGFHFSGGLGGRYYFGTGKVK